jgi:hypothetical protein
MKRPKRGRPDDSPPDEFTQALDAERLWRKPPPVVPAICWQKQVYARIRIPPLTLDEMGKILKEMARRDLMESLRNGTYLSKLLEK